MARGVKKTIAAKNAKLVESKAEKVLLKKLKLATTALRNIQKLLDVVLKKI